MLGRLLKYDLKSNAKTQSILITLVIAILPVYFLVDAIDSNFLSTLFITFAFLVSIGAFIGYAMLQVSYFATTMVGRESYFTHSLPAAEDRILLSKLLSALLWGILCVASICLFWIIFVRREGLVMPDGLADIAVPLIPMLVSQYLLAITITALSIGLSAHTRLAGFPRVIVGMVSYLVIYNACGLALLIVMGLHLMLTGELSAFINNEWQDAQVLEFIGQISVYVTVIYAALSVVFYKLAARIFTKHKSI